MKRKIKYTDLPPAVPFWPTVTLYLLYIHIPSFWIPVVGVAMWVRFLYLLSENERMD